MSTSNTFVSVSSTSPITNPKYVPLSEDLEDLFKVTFVNTKKRINNSLTDTVLIPTDLIQIAVEYLIVSNCKYKFTGLRNKLAVKLDEESKSNKALKENIDHNLNMLNSITKAKEELSLVSDTDVARQTELSSVIEMLEAEAFSIKKISKSLATTHANIIKQRESTESALNAYISFMVDRFDIDKDNVENNIEAFLIDLIKVSYHPLKDWFEEAKVNMDGKIVAKNFKNTPLYKTIKPRLDNYVLDSTKKEFGGDILGIE